jgi:hypothetical protein
MQADGKAARVDETRPVALIVFEIVSKVADSSRQRMRRLPQISGALLLFGPVFVCLQEAGAAEPWPVQLSIDQSVQYNTNVQLLPAGVLPPPPLSRGDFYSITNVGASSKAKVSLQEFFAAATYGVTRYRTDTQLDANRYSLDGGVNWKLSDFCSGRLIAVQAQSQVPVEETLSTFVVDNVVTRSADETARCVIAGPIHAIVNSGWKRSEFSQASSSLNDAVAVNFSTGLEYEIPKLNTLRAQATFIRTDFFNRVPGTGLATTLDQTQYQLYYLRDLTPKTQFIGSIGMTIFVESLSGSSLQASLPAYSAAWSWKVTPKVSVQISKSQSTAPPSGVTADLQKNNMQSASVIYAFSPKVSFTGTVSQTTTNNVTISGIGGSTVLANFRALAASAQASYQLNPFMAASASFRYQERTDSVGLTAISDVYMIALSYKPNL